MPVIPELDTLANLVRLVAQDELVPRFRRIKQHIKHDGSILTEADLAAQSALQNALASRWPDIPMLGEEMPLDRQEQLLQEASNGIWIVDPLDGTSNFSLGIPYYSVSVALVVGDHIELGVVYDPERDELFTARHGSGAFLNQERLNLSGMRQVDTMTVGMVDFKRLDASLAGKLAADPPYKSQRSFGSVALDWCWIAAGRGDVYVHGKQKMWDYAAGHIVLEEAGGYSSTLKGERVFNGSLTPRSAVLAINKPLFEKWHAFLKS